MKIAQSLAIVGVLAVALHAQSARAFLIYGVDTRNEVVSFDSTTPGITSAPIAITGLQAGESIQGIDFRPINGVLYALGSMSRLYTLNPVTGVASQVGSAGAFTLVGTSFGFDFNPVPDRIRVTSDANQNLRLNPNNGTLTATDTSLAYAPGDANSAVDPNIAGSAYTNSVAGAVTTTLYGIDSSLDTLVTQSPPNAGVLNTVGALGVDVIDLIGFDILADGNQAIMSTNLIGAASSTLYSIDLSTGAASLIGTIGGLPLLALAIAPVEAAEPATVAALGAGLLALLGHRRPRARRSHRPF